MLYFKFAVKYLGLLFITTYHLFGFGNTIKIGSKTFTENFILAEIMAQYLEDHGFKIERNFGLSGTLMAFSALQTGEIDIYAEYSGTISLVILKESKDLAFPILQEKMTNLGLRLLDPFGFNNTYALAIRKEIADKYLPKTISDIKYYPLIAGFSHEFTKRNDGWMPLKAIYGLNFIVKTIEHSLAYDSIKAGIIDVMDVYTTDAKIEKFNLHILEDDKHFFPSYFAAPLIKNTLDTKAIELLKNLNNTISEVQMRALNAEVEFNKKSYAQVAYDFLKDHNMIQTHKAPKNTFDWLLLVKRILQHLYLTFIAVLFATCLAIPLGIFLTYFPVLAQSILTLIGLIQTIPSMALLVFMIPLFGMGDRPAIMALLLYSLLPILRNTYTALTQVDKQLIETARGIGLYKWERLIFVQIPLGLPIILTGIRTASVIGIGTATLAAFIGAGGLGDFIVEGLTLNDIPTILNGAIPAALLAILVELLFTKLEKRLSGSI